MTKIVITGTMDDIDRFPLTKTAKAPGIEELWDAVERSLCDASKAFPVLLTMLKQASDSRGKALDLRGAAMVADEMIANVKYAQKALKVLRGARAEEGGT